MYESDEPPAPFLVVDLDGTLIKTDMFVESAIWNFLNKPLLTLKAFIEYALKGNKAQLKQSLAASYTFKTQFIPLNTDVTSLIKEYKSKGSAIVLATGSDKRIARKFSEEMPGFFDHVLASDGKVNLTSSNKANLLVEKFGVFDYVGDSRSDLPVWKRANKGFTVKRIRCNLSVWSITRRRGLFEECLTVLRQIRVHQWSKNLLLTLSIVLSHRFTEADSWLRVLLGIFAFGCISSAVYVFNDLVDLQNDREHATKRLRPLASGAMPITQGIAVGLIALFLGLLVAIQLGSTSFIFMLMAYLAVNLLYSFWLKKTLIYDVVVLALIYQLRLWAGAALIDENLSFWILSFSTFFFLSLAFLKRYSEIVANGLINREASGRAYENIDRNIVLVAGISSNFIAMSFLALYLDSPAVKAMYQTPFYLWTWLPVLVTWSLSMWVKSNRGNLPYDPILFALRDPSSLVSLAVIICAFLLAMFA